MITLNYLTYSGNLELYYSNVKITGYYTRDDGIFRDMKSTNGDTRRYSVINYHEDYQNRLNEKEMINHNIIIDFAMDVI
jgi:hypothetical protein